MGVGAAWQLNQLRFGDQSDSHGRRQPAHHHPGTHGRHPSFSHPIPHGRTNRHTNRHNAANGHTNPYRHSHGDSNRYGNRHSDHHTHTLNHPHTNSHDRARLAHRSTAYPLRPASGRGR
jgi:hypothetical protein